MISLLLVPAAVAAPVAPAAPPPVQQRYDVPEAPAQQVVVLERVFPVHGESGWHTHPGVEIGVVVSGETEMRLADGTRRLYRAGESFLIPRGIVHNGVNIGGVEARAILTYVVDRGQPLRADAVPTVTKPE